MFDTPQEAALKAENARLRAENDWLRRAVEAPGRTVRPWGVEEEILVSPDVIGGDRITLMKRAGVDGVLQDDHRWSVVAWHDRLDGGRLTVSYFVDRAADQYDDNLFSNVILPKMHEKFIWQLSDIYK